MTKPILCPTCPSCNGEPLYVLGPEQAFCGGDCATLCWDMTQTAEHNRANTTEVDLSGVPYPGEGA